MTVRVLILGTGGMANSHVEAYAAMADVSVVAGVDTNAQRLAEFQSKHGIAHGFASLDEAIAWGDFDAVSNVTPDAVHHATTLPLLAAGKHVLCEKPLAANEDDANEMARAASNAGVINMVNLTYRNVPAVMKAAEMVADGAIGEVRHFEASYLQSWLTQSLWGDWQTESQWLWRLSQKHGSLGVLGDVGVHILDFATLVAGANPADLSCRLTTFHKAPGGQIGEYPLDANDSFNMHLVLENGAAGVIHASRFASGHINDLRLRIFGTKGGLDVRFEGEESALFACHDPDLQTATWNKVDTPAVKTNYRRFIEAILSGSQALPDFARGAALQVALDAAVASDQSGGKNTPVAT